MKPTAALALCTLLLAALATTTCLADSQRERHHTMGQGARKLQQSQAISQATGGNTASASANATPTSASTSQSATGPGSTAQGVSQVGAKVNSCQQGPANSAACQTLTTADRTSQCTDIAPDANFTCPQQASFGKCAASFIYGGGFCLKSCNRCGNSCYDTTPSGGSCSFGRCNSTAVTGGPYCLKTCGRCSTST